MKPSAADLLEACRKELDKVVHPDPKFDFEIGITDNYSDLLSDDFREKTTDLGHVLELARFHGRFLISAHAGTGKTSLAFRLMDHALRSGEPAFHIDLRRWTPRLDRMWQSAGDAEPVRVALLLDHLVHPNFDGRVLRTVIEEDGALVVVDGLNEVPASTAQEIPNTLEKFATRYPSATVLLCDRFQRRHLPSDDWLLGTITCVRSPAHTGLQLDSALLMDISDGRTTDEEAEADLLLRYLCKSAQIHSPEDSNLDESALRLYESKTRYFEWAALTALADQPVPDRLVESGSLVREQGWAFYRHHLFHDALAAHAVARQRSRWSPACFDTLTFNANSFDAIGLGLELLEDEAAADGFLLSVYDWNLYAAAYALARGRRLGRLAVSSNIEEAMLAVLAERRWDSVAPSAERVEDALRVFKTPLARRYLQAEDLAEVLQIVSEGQSERVSEDWRTLFMGEADLDHLVAALGEGGPLNGWIAANALRRRDLSETDIQLIGSALTSGDRTVRWRAAHVLGAQPSSQSAQMLFKALDRDDWVWVRYGAIRSLVEAAGASEQLRSWVIDGLVKRTRSLTKDPLVIGELEKALQLREPPVGWASSVAPLLEVLFSIAPTVPDQDHWRAVGRRVEDAIRSARMASA
jgi:hypothetical protein